MTAQMLDNALDLHRAGRLAEASAAYNQVLLGEPQNVDAMYGLGTVLMQKGDLEQAASLLNDAVALAPDSPEITFNYALVVEKLGYVQTAVRGYLKVAHLSRSRPDVMVTVCRKLLALGMPQEAYDELRRIKERSTELDTLTAQAQAASGDWPGAVEKLRALLHEGTADARVWREIAAAAARIQDFETAISAFEAFLDAGTPTGEDYLDYAELLLAVRNLDAAESALLDHQIDETGKREYMLAKIARFRNEPAKTRTHLLAAIDAQPSHAESWNLLIESESREGLPEMAARCRELSEGDAGTEREKVLLALAAGRAFDRLGRYSDAFACYLSGNTRHKELLLRSGRAYGPASTERNIDGIMARFTRTTPRTGSVAENGGPVFIVGMPRSGTTLMEKILSCLDGVTAAGELMALEFVAAQYYRSLPQSDSSAEVVLSAEKRAALVESYWRWAGLEPALITDKMPHNFRNVGLIASMFPASPVIYMRRDPRDVCLSIFSRFLMDGHPYACDLDWLAHFYAQSARIMSYWQELYPDRVLEVIYEDLVDDLEGTTRKIADFCGLPWSPACLDFDKKEGSSFTFSEVQVRRPLNREGIGRWRHYEQELAPLSKLLIDNNLI